MLFAPPKHSHTQPLAPLPFISPQISAWTSGSLITGFQPPHPSSPWSAQQPEASSPNGLRKSDSSRARTSCRALQPHGRALPAASRPADTTLMGLSGYSDRTVTTLAHGFDTAGHMGPWRSHSHSGAILGRVGGPCLTPHPPQPPPSPLSHFILFTAFITIGNYALYLFTTLPINNSLPQPEWSASWGGGLSCPLSRSQGQRQ